MQVIQEILKQKEEEVQQLQREIEALRTVLQILQQVETPANPPEAGVPAAAVKVARATAGSEAEARSPSGTPRQFP